jgi:hypothetical protein
MEEFLKLIEPLIIAYSGKYGVIVQVIAVIGSLRAIMKPIVSAISSYVKSTPKLTDDAKLEKIMNNKVVKFILFLLDWIASIKMPKKK